MNTQCNPRQLQFQYLASRRVVGGFDGTDMSSDGGLRLLREVDKRFNFSARLAECFVDSCSRACTKHSLLFMLRQRVFDICCGYEDINDHDELCDDSIFKLCCECEEALADKSTLNHTELGADALALS